MSLSKKSKFIISFLIAFVLAFIIAYNYAYKSHTAIEDMEVAYAGNTQEFLSKVKETPEAWTQGEKVIQLTGLITAIDDKGISLNESIYFQLAEGTTTENLAEGKKIIIKGRIIGYDDLLEELKLDKAIIVKK
ncbi:hypothetical protein U8527_07795 [Kordia algicida OT-1]|uniref:tRNA_anti-like n=1 Tax=Kordia algicida OT-1 TaxID=391587 RepID=A9E8S9_9FLAO|nr:hypothetical protein [Kordia algicida]EDP94806.1 hypothetical protein KAOT1_01230 [Kordia algicida OT-1]